VFNRKARYGVFWNKTLHTRCSILKNELMQQGGFLTSQTHQTLINLNHAWTAQTSMGTQASNSSYLFSGSRTIRTGGGRKSVKIRICTVSLWFPLNPFPPRFDTQARLRRGTPSFCLWKNVCLLKQIHTSAVIASVIAWEEPQYVVYWNQKNRVYTFSR